MEFIAGRGSATVRETAERLGYPTPSVYRMVRLLVRAGYLAHVAGGRRLELGYAPRRIASAANRRLSVPPALKEILDTLHRTLRMAAYFTVYRGGDVVVAHVSDCAEHPRIRPGSIGFHMAAHATAFGKIMLAGMSARQRALYLEVHGAPPVQPGTITDRDRLAAHLAEVALTGIAWEREEFLAGVVCAAVGVHNPAGLVVGSVAVSAPVSSMSGREPAVEQVLRAASNHVSRYFRTGPPSRAAD